VGYGRKIYRIRDDDIKASQFGDGFLDSADAVCFDAHVLAKNQIDMVDRRKKMYILILQDMR
jgi:hypothetical protein